MTGSAYTVALAMIARDEGPRIGRLLASVAPWVDHMLVLDTGSADDTAAVAMAHGARVEHFAWRDDFAAARNVALALAGADWHVVLDADDMLLDGGAALAALRHTPPGFVGAVQIQEQGAAAGLVQAWTSRVLPGGVRYTGRVHEQPQHALPVRRLPVLVRHDGYTPERLAAKQGRNRHLLLAMLAEAPDDAYLWFQLGKDHAAYDEHAAAAAAFERADALRSPEHGWHRDLAARLLYALKRCGQHAQAMRVAELRMDACSDSPDFFFALGDLLLDWTAERPDEAAQLLPLAQAAWQRCLELGEQPDQPGSVQGRGSWLAAHNLAVVHDGLGQTAEAAALRARHPWPDDPQA
jgi:glycosyltransferase involved in cell wall biosynthesis